MTALTAAPRRLSRLIAPIAVTTAMALALTACGGDDASDNPDSNAGAEQADSDEDSNGEASGELRNGEIPDSDPDDAWDSEEVLPEEPDQEDPLDEQISHELLSEAADFARDYDEDATVDCPDMEFGDDAEETCDMTYFGHDLTWDVEVSGGSMVASYEFDSDNRVVSRQFVEDSLRFEADSEDVGCDMEEYLLMERDSGEETMCEAQEDDGASTWELSLSGYGSPSFYVEN